jgi:hypothetical protein
MDETVREYVRQRGGHRCEYCLLRQADAPFATFHVEHIRAKQHDGSDDPSNLALACPHCNSHKGPNLSAIDPQTDEVVMLFNPRADDWRAHFSVNGLFIEGYTASGRATVNLLAMNAESRLRVRAALQSDE